MGAFDYINSFLHPEDAYKAAQGPVNKGYREARGYQEPFIHHGEEQYGRLNEASGRLMHPEEFSEKWGGQFDRSPQSFDKMISGYQTSPYAKQLLAANLGSGQEAASSMGLSGSSAALSNIQKGAGDIVSRDRSQYLSERNQDIQNRRNYTNDLMQQYLSGIGIGQNLYGVGANTAGNLSGQAIEHGRDIAGLKYGETAAPGQLFGKAVGTALNLYQPGAGSSFTGGNSSGFNSGAPGYQ